MPTDANNAEADARLMQQVFRMNREVTKLGLAYARKKEAASEAKKAYEAAQSDMSAFINANQAPLFDEVGDEGGGEDDDEEDGPDFTRPGPRVVGKLTAGGDLVCPRCGGTDMGPVDGGDPMCNGCNATVAYPAKSPRIA